MDFIAADIATSADGASDVFVADIDGDGDLDIVSASISTTRLPGMKMMEQRIQHLLQHDIATSADGAELSMIFIADIDG